MPRNTGQKFARTIEYAQEEGSFEGEGLFKGKGLFKSLECSDELPGSELTQRFWHVPTTLGRMDTSPPDPPDPAYLPTKPLREGITSDLVCPDLA